MCNDTGYSELLYKGVEITKKDREAYIYLKKEIENKINKRKLWLIFIVMVLLLSVFNVQVDMAIFQTLSETDKYVFVILFSCIGLFIQMGIAIRIREESFNKIKEIYLCSIPYEVNTGERKWNIMWVLLSIVTPDYKFAKQYKDKIKDVYIQHVRRNECMCHCSCDLEYKDIRGLCIHCYDSIKFMNKFFIKFSNWKNLIVTMYIVLAMIIWMMLLKFQVFQNNGIEKLGDMIFIILFSLLVYRLVSRSIEIAVAFYFDIVRVNSKIFYIDNDKVGSDDAKKPSSIYVHKWRNSYIRKPLRLSLAIHSLFELILMFTMMFLLTFIICNGLKVQENMNREPAFSMSQIKGPFLSTPIDGNEEFESPKDKDDNKIKEYISTKKIYEFFLYSISLSFFNISYINYGFGIWNILHVWQVTMSMILIILSIASYLGGDDSLLKREEEFFANVLPSISKENL